MAICGSWGEKFCLVGPAGGDGMSVVVVGGGGVRDGSQGGDPPGGGGLSWQLCSTSQHLRPSPFR